MTWDGWLILQRNFPAILPEVIRVVAVSMSLAVIAEEMIEALIQRITLTAGASKSPFPECSCHIPLLFEHFSDREFFVRNRELSFRLSFTVVSNPGSSGMPSGQEHAS